MLKRKASELFCGLTLVLGLLACESAPQREILAAKAALEEALNAQGNVYATESLRKAQDPLDSAMAEVGVQKDEFAFFRDYERAKELLREAKTLAEEARAEAETKGQEARRVAHEAIGAAQAALEEARAGVDGTLAGSRTRRDIAATSSALETLTGALAQAQKAFDRAEFLDARSKAEMVLTQAERISLEIAWAGAGPHALLFPSGARFGTTASDQLAIHGPITIEFWMKITKPRGGALEIALHNFKFWIRKTGVTFLVQSAHSLRRSDLGVGTWRHVTGTFDGATMRLFVDGLELANGGAWLAGNSLGVRASIAIHEVDSPAPVVAIDDLRIWNHARSGEQVRGDMRHGLLGPNNEPGVVALFGFNEGSGQAVKNVGHRHLDAWLGQDPGRPDAADPFWVNDTPESPQDTAPEVAR